MDKLVADKIEQINRLCKKYDVKSMYLFGSGTLDQLRKESDIDILVSFLDIPVERYTDNYFNLHDELERLLDRKVDLITERSLSNPYFIASIEKTKELLYAA